ncbi:MAG: type II secretion system F family protein [Magnetococcales bacterium]|nr:type II secretion system F family protein [Magnetococcales bacterium]
MAVFNYIGIRSGNGRKAKGVMDADSERDARQILKNKGIYVTELTRRRGMRSVSNTPSNSKKINFRQYLPQGRPPSMRERIVFTRQMAGLLEAGFPVIDTLIAVEEQVQSGPLKGIITEIRDLVSEGQALSDSLARYPKLFPPLYTSMVRAGETSGALEKIFNRLADVMEAQFRLRRQLTSAMIYPTIMIVVGILILFFLMTVVVPKVVGIFEGVQQTLPLVTRILLTVSDFAQQWGVTTLISLVVALLLFSRWAQTKKGRIWVENRQLRTPLIKGLFIRVITLRVCQTLGLLLQSGVPILQSLRISGEVTGYVTVQKAMETTAQEVTQGTSLASALRQTGYFPSLALRMIQAGEKAGNLEIMLDKIAQSHEEEISAVTERAMNLVEPMVVLMMGGVVTFVVVAVLLPLFEMNQLIQ